MDALNILSDIFLPDSYFTVPERKTQQHFLSVTACDAQLWKRRHRSVVQSARLVPSTASDIHENNHNPAPVAA